MAYTRDCQSVSALTTDVDFQLHVLVHFNFELHKYSSKKIERISQHLQSC